MSHDDILKLWRDYEGRGADAVVLFAQAIEAAERERLIPEIERLRVALKLLADAADDVVVLHLDSDDIPTSVELMQIAVTSARRALGPNVKPTGAPR